MTRKQMIDLAVGINENYRDDIHSYAIQIGFLYGTAEMIVAHTIKKNESYHDLREELATEIDKKAAKKSYPILPKNGYKPK